MAESMTSKLTRVGVQGDPCENIHHRRGSAPRVSRISQGSMTFPTLLDILRPSASTMCPRHSTLRYGRGSPHQGVDGQQGVEPAPGLVDGLADEVGRVDEALGRVLGHRVAPLGRGHRARVEPGVDDRLHPTHLPAAVPALRAGQGDLVDGRTVGIDSGHVPAGQLRTARPAIRRSGDGPRRSARRAAGCPRSGHGTGPSPRCWPATPPSGRPGCARGAIRWSGSGPPARPCAPRSGCTSWACPSRSSAVPHRQQCG